jgi:hypothetical protein
MPRRVAIRTLAQMPSLFHPHQQESRRVAGNRLRLALRHWPQTVFHLAGGAVLLFLVGAGVGRIDGDRIGLVLRLLAAQPLLLGIAFAGFGLAMVRSSTLTLAEEFRTGWWGAIPVPAAATRHSLQLNALLLTLFGNAVVLAVLLLVVWLSRRSTDWFTPVALTASVALWLGALLGYFGARRRERLPPTALAKEHSSAALVRLAALDHPHLHNIPDWQRRETTRRWRAGGRRWQLGGLALLIPASMPAASLAGLSLLGIALIWYGLALRASEDSIIAADRLCAALPLPFARFAAATLRYPLFAWLCAALLGLVGLLLQSAGLLLSIALMLALGIGSVLSLSLTWRYRKRPWLARTRATAETCLLLLLAYQFPPLALLAALALIARHYYVARSVT